jgi:pimeloyl-ACP methyl ester carboxylesterase
MLVKISYDKYENILTVINKNHLNYYFIYKPATIFPYIIEAKPTTKYSSVFNSPSYYLLIIAAFFVVLLFVPNMVVLEQGLSTAMNTKIIGSGSEVIVLAHGFGGDQSVWEKIVPQLSQHYRVLVFDWTFSGAVKDPNLFDPVKYSSYDAFASDLIALVDEMNLQSLVFVGHSMSGMIGCIASIKRPELFKRLILIGASPRCLQKYNMSLFL